MSINFYAFPWFPKIFSLSGETMVLKYIDKNLTTMFHFDAWKVSYIL